MKYSSSSMYSSVTTREGADPEETGCRFPQHRRQQHGSTRRRPSHCAVVAGEHNSSTSGMGSVVSKVARLPSYQQKTHTSLLSNFSAQGTAVVRVKILRTYIGHRTTLGLTCCRRCSRGTPNSGGTSRASNNARQQQRQRRQRHTCG